ncbi:hypothetical protein RISK_003082 [Rhodopirellula islandica]|uniref:Transmembrane protein n=1 Tax=Rhodopirellula islandica TaxID=595434 RepID=A0A0J1EGZ5_RHOIS|nr:hypothetical protein RISK_003082 [Rhodopirellula islandica]
MQIHTCCVSRSPLPWATFFFSVLTAWSLMMVIPPTMKRDATFAARHSFAPF